MNVICLTCLDFQVRRVIGAIGENVQCVDFVSRNGGIIRFSNLDCTSLINFLWKIDE